jgi:hypothetical protein
VTLRYSIPIHKIPAGQVLFSSTNDAKVRSTNWRAYALPDWLISIITLIARVLGVDHNQGRHIIVNFAVCWAPADGFQKEKLERNMVQFTSERPKACDRKLAVFPV